MGFFSALIDFLKGFFGFSDKSASSLLSVSNTEAVSMLEKMKQDAKLQSELLKKELAKSSGDIEGVEKRIVSESVAGKKAEVGVLKELESDEGKKVALINEIMALEKRNIELIDGVQPTVAELLRLSNKNPEHKTRIETLTRYKNSVFKIISENKARIDVKKSTLVAEDAVIKEESERADVLSRAA